MIKFKRLFYLKKLLTPGGGASDELYNKSKYMPKIKSIRTAVNACSTTQTHGQTDTMKNLNSRGQKKHPNIYIYIYISRWSHERPPHDAKESSRI